MPSRCPSSVARLRVDPPSPDATATKSTAGCGVVENEVAAPGGPCPPGVVHAARPAAGIRLTASLPTCSRLGLLTTAAAKWRRAAPRRPVRAISDPTMAWYDAHNLR